MSQTDLPEDFDTAAATTRIDRIWSQVPELTGTYLGVLAGMRSAAELAYA